MNFGENLNEAKLLQAGNFVGSQLTRALECRDIGFVLTNMTPCVYGFCYLIGPPRTSSKNSTSYKRFTKPTICGRIKSKLGKSIYFILRFF